MTKGKKPARMSQFTVNELQEMLDSYKEEYIHKTDPVGSFIHSQAVKLNFLQGTLVKSCILLGWLQRSITYISKSLCP